MIQAFMKKTEKEKGEIKIESSNVILKQTEYHQNYDVNDFGNDEMKVL